MANNYLEQLIAEWYEYRGYYIRRNVKVGKLERGGYRGELDLVGFNPSKNHLIHVEPSVDAESWAKREKRYLRKFEAGRKYIHTLFEGFNLPEEIEQIALFATGSTLNYKTVGGGRVVLMVELFHEILADLKHKSILKESIPESQPLLRTLQIVAHYRKNLYSALYEGEI